MNPSDKVLALALAMRSLSGSSDSAFATGPTKNEYPAEFRTSTVFLRSQDEIRALKLGWQLVENSRQVCRRGNFASKF